MRLCADFHTYRKKRMYNPHAGKWQPAGAWYEYARTGTTPAPF